MTSSSMPAAVSERQPAVLEARNLFRAGLRDLEWRTPGDTGDGSYTFTGHAAVFGQPTTLYSGPGFAMTEEIAPGAFDEVLRENPDVHLNLNHDMSRVIARTGVKGVGQLELTVDSIGLRTFARLDSGDPDVVSLAAKMSRGLVDQMSFAFQIGQYELSTTVDEESGFETDHRVIRRVATLYDVCACAQGAYPTTDASLRSLCAAFGRTSSDLVGHDPHRSSEGAVDDRDDTNSSGGLDPRQHRVHVMRQKLALATAQGAHRT
jgi:HK97 family phage prohead protease